MVAVLLATGLLLRISAVFFCQAEDGIREADVTGVQTCALPICSTAWRRSRRTGPSGIRPTTTWRSSSCSRTWATTSATTRTPSRPRATSGRRASARRHARLLDYRVHSGCNARAWVVFDVDVAGGADGQPIDEGTVLLSRGDEDETTVAPADLPKLLTAERPTVFETMHAITLRSAHNAISFYTWSDERCCLPKGATRATLQDDPKLDLAVGDVVLFEEIRSPTTGVEADADPTHRHAVRLTAADHVVDELDGTPVLEIAWAAADALPFPLCVSAVVTPPSGPAARAEIAVARGNAVLADHGLSLASEALVPREAPAGRPYRPHLARGPLTFRAAFDEAAPATAATRTDPRKALPVVTVTGEGETWTPQFDLLGSEIG